MTCTTDLRSPAKDIQHDRSVAKDGRVFAYSPAELMALTDDGSKAVERFTRGLKQKAIRLGTDQASFGFLVSLIMETFGKKQKLLSDENLDAAFDSATHGGHHPTAAMYKMAIAIK
jgi:hypothetical protein